MAEPGEGSTLEGAEGKPELKKKKKSCAGKLVIDVLVCAKSHDQSVAWPEYICLYPNIRRD